MIKALIDTNVVLDALAGREPFCTDAEKIFMLAAEGKIQGFVTASSITDIYYLVRKNRAESMARAAIRHLLHVFSVVDINGTDCEAALDALIMDYEDALVAICALKAGADDIVTRDEAFLKARTDISVVTPAMFLEKRILRTAVYSTSGTDPN